MNTYNLINNLWFAVVECKITHFIGICGIMIRETAEAFGIITEDNKFRGNPSII